MRKILDERKEGKTMKKARLLWIPEGSESTKEYKVPFVTLYAAAGLALLLVAAIIAGFWTMGSKLNKLSEDNKNYEEMLSKTVDLKKDALFLKDKLDSLESGIDKIKNYAKKIDSAVAVRAKNLKSQTGFKENSNDRNIKPNVERIGKLTQYANNLEFGGIMNKLNFLQEKAEKDSFFMQDILARLTKNSLLLRSVPSFKPVDGWLSSGFGYRTSPFTGVRKFHRGIDVAARAGTPIYAPANGVVVYSGTKQGYGKYVAIAHGNGLVTKYGHNAANYVKVGHSIKRGEKIATVGSTGNSTGPHLHYEVWQDGKAVNPQKYLVDDIKKVAFLSF